MSIDIAVMVSGHGRGSNLQAIIDACSSGRIEGRVALVIGVRAGVPAMDRASSQGITTIEIAPGAFDSDLEYGREILKLLRCHGIDLVCLAGFMRVLPSEVVSEFRSRIMNTHAALIPSFCGRGMYGENVHRAVIEYGVKVSGCTIHFVDEEYDSGPIIVQKCVPVEEGDTPETLAARILPLEHQAYVEAIRLFADGRLSVSGRVVVVAPSGTPAAG